MTDGVGDVPKLVMDDDRRMESCVLAIVCALIFVLSYPPPLAGKLDLIVMGCEFVV